VTRERVNAYLWLNNTPIPQELCDREPLLKDYGLYRKLNTGGFEFISFCETKVNQFYSMHKDDLARILNGNKKSSNQKAAIRALAPALSTSKDIGR
jgi:hypothetical protein